MTAAIDVCFYFPTDAGGGDPDRTSPTLRRYHKLPWSKPLPDGREFNLDDTTPNAYLHHESDAVGEVVLARDSVIHTFRRWRRTAPIIDQIPDDEIDHFYHLAYTIGAMLVFPGNKIDGQMTINGAQGLNQRICDRLDLTLECIRRHYIEESSPLAQTLERDRYFFDLFQDFRGYTDFFLLQDLLYEGGLEVKFFTEDFDGFSFRPLPGDVDTYRTYMDRSIKFIEARNGRIQNWAEGQPHLAGHG